MRFAFAMLNRQPRRDRRLIAFVSACALFAALFGVATWLVVSLASIPKEDQAIIVSITSGLGAALGAIFGQPVFAVWLQRHLEGPVPSELTTAELGDWVVTLREAALDRRVRGVRSQREQMLRGGALVDPDVPSDAGVQIGEAGRPRIRIGGTPKPWSEIVGAWAASKGRMVVLGDPGYGKTVAALTLVEHINRGGGDVVAEIFPLAEWHTWSAGRDEDAYLEDWIAEQVSQTYIDVPLTVSKALVARGRLVPVLDGLDEVPESARGDCVDAISAYAGSGDSSRSFAVTCRQREYFALAPRWVGADRHVVLVGLDPGQIVTILKRQAELAGRWQSVLEAIRNGNQAVIDFLRSPLRFGAAMQIYRHRDAREVLELAERPDGQAMLWDRLLSQARTLPTGASPVEVRGWLAFFAASLKSHDRQRFHLHELYLYGAPSDRRLFGRLTTAIVGVTIALYALRDGAQVEDMFFALVIPMYWLITRKSHGEPFSQPVAIRVPLRLYVAELPVALAIAVVAAVAMGVVAMVVVGVIVAIQAAAGDSEPLIDVVGRTVPFAVMIAVVVALMMATMVVAQAGQSSVTTEPPKQLGGRDAGAVLSAVGRHGLVSLTVAGAVGAAALAIGAAVGLLYEELLWLVVIFVVLSAWSEGLSAWLYFHWTRWRLARRGRLPFRLQEFLEWASSHQVGWLRFGDGYEFRHRELLDHLAVEGAALGAGNRSLAEAEATRTSAGGPRARQGDRLLASGDFEGALKAYSDAAAQSPLRAAYARKRSLALDKLGRHEEQLAAAQHAAKLDPDDAAHHIAVGVAYARLQNDEASLAAYDRAVVLAPNKALAHRNRLIALGKLERWTEQLEAIDRAIALEPKSADLHHTRSLALDKLARHEEQG